MRALMCFSIVFVLAGLAPALARAQATPLAAETRLAAQPAEQSAAAAASPGKRLLWAASGAALGAWLGFFASQVHTGDWDQPERPVDRHAWTAAGAALGITLGLSFPLSGYSPGATVVARELDRRAILGEEVQKAGVANAYEAVRFLRPEWLVLRGVGSWRETPRVSMDGFGPSFTVATEEPAEMRLRAYLNGVLLGDVEALGEVSASDVREIHFLDAAAAAARWGTGHGHGAVLVITR